MSTEEDLLEKVRQLNIRISNLTHELAMLKNILKQPSAAPSITVDEAQLTAVKNKLLGLKKLREETLALI